MKKSSKSETVVAREQRIRDHWQLNKTFEQSVDNRKDSPPFVFYEGPPTANGLPHVGHAFGRTVKDVVSRYKTMRGYYVERKAGWDTHGLPVELGVEKQLGISGKQPIEEYGVAPFIERCKESVFTYEKKWRSFTEELGYWVDMDDPYVTLDNDYIESVWSILSKVHKDGLLYKGHRVSPYCPSCQTTLSSHEVAQGYQDVKDLSATVKFPVIGEENTFFLGWTTTPWTLPANVALAVHPDLTYAEVEHEGAVYIVAKALVAKLFGDNAHITRQHQGAEFVGKKYVAPFDYVSIEKGHVVVAANFVTDDSGTGIVHLAPAYGEDDYKVIQENELSFVNVVGLDGRYTVEVTDLQGVFVKDADVSIIQLLASKGLLFHKEKYEHSYPHCWRCDSPLLYYATDSWFIRMTAMKDQLMAANQTVDWYPGHIKDGRFGNFLENVLDWNIGRNRYWGTPLNVWSCTTCHHEVAPGSVKEIRQLSEHPLPEAFDLHKPFIDDVTLACPDCSGSMQRTPEVIDVWFDSGSMPFAQHHYPFENQDTFAQQFPADVVIEGIDQTRGFFYSLLAVSTLMTGKAPYKNVLSLGHVLDEHGQKMSKSKGNALDPTDLMHRFGADSLRWSFLVDSSPWNPKRFSEKIVQDAKSKVIDTLDNTYKFYSLYAGIDAFQYDAANTGERTLLDRWILSRLHSTIKTVVAAMDDYQFTAATRQIAALLDELSNWYVRRSRSRFWVSGMSEDKRAAFSTLYEVLTTVTRLLAPFTPYVADDLYEKLTSSSVHLADYPACEEAWINSSLESSMARVLQVVELGRSLRNATSLKTKQPLARLVIALDEKVSLDDAALRIVKDELNVKHVERTQALNDFFTLQAKVNFKTAGAVFGKHVNALKLMVEDLPSMAVHELLASGSLVVDLEGTEFTILPEHVLVEKIVREGFVLAEESGVSVLLDTTLTSELVEEGYVRELIRAVQDKRKQLDLPVEVYVDLWVDGAAHATAVVERFESLLRQNVLVRSLHVDAIPEEVPVVEVAFGDNVVVVGIQ
ncbi:isoleucine--tRNA ligase [Chryseomicrobium palamuruense]|uniref:Isoleucine--tRNA ligase n=1 Tax=Chryseomicrobium palamuruense TaxID=682973 RepID=A0ABV8UY74_9BACL